MPWRAAGIANAPTAVKPDVSRFLSRLARPVDKLHEDLIALERHSALGDLPPIGADLKRLLFIPLERDEGAPSHSEELP